MPQKSLFFVFITVMFYSLVSSAFTLRGEIQPDRYTYYLMPEYAQTLKSLNDKKGRDLFVRIPHGELTADSSYQQAKGLPAPTAMTCISSIYFNEGARENWLRVACVDNNGLEYTAHQKWPSQSIAKRVCKVGEARCDSFLALTSDSWSDPK